MSRIVKVIISCLITGLTILSIYTGNLLYNKTHKQILTNDNKPQQEQSIRIIDKEVIQKALNDENRLVVLSGQVETEATFTNERISDNDVKLKWLKQQWNKLNSKELKVNSTYNYEFSYDLTNLPITIHNNTINITIIKGNLNLSKCELNSIETKQGKLDCLQYTLMNRYSDIYPERYRDIFTKTDEDKKNLLKEFKDW